MQKEQYDWAPFALLLIDMQHDFWPADMAEKFPDLPQNCARLLAVCRDQGIDVVHLRARFRADRSDWMPLFKFHGSIPCISGTAGVEPLPFAEEAPGETVIEKQTFDGFLQPDLAAYLQKKNKRVLLTAGLITSVCVFFTSNSAAQSGFLTVVVEDCCADQETHDASLQRLDGFVFGRTRSTRLVDSYPEWKTALEKLDRVPSQPT